MMIPSETYLGGAWRSFEMAWSHASFFMRALREGPPKHTDECRRYRESEKARKLAPPPSHSATKRL